MDYQVLSNPDTNTDYNGGNNMSDKKKIKWGKTWNPSKTHNPKKATVKIINGMKWTELSPSKNRRIKFKDIK